MFEFKNNIMAGHSKWANIKHKKGIADAKRGKVFTKHAKLIALAAQGGSDPDMNSALRSAIDNAKADNVPNDNIKRAVAKGSGEGGSANQMVEVKYEGYGPSGIAMIIEGVTDNKNRTFTNIRTIMSKNGGNLGESGCTSYLFDNRTIVEIKANGDKDEQIMDLIELGALDVEESDDNSIVAIIDFQETNNFKEKCKDKYEIISSRRDMIPQNTTEISDEISIEKINKLIEKLEDDEDVTDVFTSALLPE